MDMPTLRCRSAHGWAERDKGGDFGGQGGRQACRPFAPLAVMCHDVAYAEYA